MIDVADADLDGAGGAVGLAVEQGGELGQAVLRPANDARIGGVGARGTYSVGAVEAGAASLKWMRGAGALPLHRHVGR